MAIVLQQYESVVTDFLEEIPTGAETRSIRLLRKLEAEGGRIRTPDSKAIGDGLFELRPSHSGVEYRLVYFFKPGAAVFVECFVKKSQKTPKTNLENAKRRKSELENGGYVSDIALN